MAAWAAEYSIVFEGQTVTAGASESGASASTPTWAGVLSLLPVTRSDLRLNAGKAPLGFANPFLYALW